MNLLLLGKKSGKQFKLHNDLPLNKVDFTKFFVRAQIF